ncbi:MAG: tetratricopeptide repeat protein [Bacteroidales bacterium]|nr:tetratricopeptide repeat protein [Bacteroidales bacterium]
MKKILLTIMIALCGFAFASAQDMEKATEIYNNAAEAIKTDKAEAITLFEQALEMASQLGEEGENIVTQCKGILPQLYMSVGKEMVNAKDLNGAIEQFKKAIEKGEAYGDPEVVEEAKGLIPQILMAEGNGQLKAGEFEGAVATFQKIIDADPTNGKAHFSKGQALTRLNKTEEAIKAFELAAENGEEANATKQLSNAYVKKAAACQKAKDMKGALENAQKSTQYVDNANAQKIIGVSALSLKQNKVAADGFEAYLSMTPDAVTKEPGIVYQLGMALVGAGENDKACGYFKKIAQDAKWGEGARYQITQLKCK